MYRSHENSCICSFFGAFQLYNFQGTGLLQEGRLNAIAIDAIECRPDRASDEGDFARLAFVQHALQGRPYMMVILAAFGGV